MATRPLSYAIESRRISGAQHYRPHAVAHCASCGNAGAIAISPNHHNPEAIGQKFRDHKWEFNPFQKSGCTCPDCIARRKLARAGESPNRAMQPAGGSASPSKRESEPSAAPVPHSSKEDKTVTQTLTLVPTGAGITVLQRGKVREFLAGTFDEQRGHYLDGYSDARVAKEHNVPEAAVRELREVAFGPLKSVPELDALLVDQKSLEERSRAHVREAGEISASVTDLRRRLEAAATRLGVRA